MKKSLCFLCLQGILLLFLSCRDKADAVLAFNDYRRFVISHRDSPEKYLPKSIAILDEEYNVKRWKAERQRNRWSKKMQADYMELQLSWETFHSVFQAEKERRENLEHTSKLVTTVLPLGIDESLSNVNATNVVAVYRHLVSYVESRSAEFSPQQWNQIQSLWDRLIRRFSQIESDLNGAEKAAVSEQKIRFEVIKSIHQPVAKMEDR